MKIKFAGYWNSDYNIYMFINDIWNIDGRYDDFITYADDYTHLVIMNYVNNSIYRIEKIILMAFYLNHIGLLILISICCLTVRK